MPLLRWYAAVSGVLVASYLVWPFHLRQWPFLAVTLAAVPAALAGLRRTPPGARVPWWLLLAALVCYNAGNIIWIWMVEVEGRPTGAGSVADLFNGAGGILVLASAIVVVVRRGRGDVGGVIDSAITAVALSGLLWDALLLPELTAARVPVEQQIVLFLTIFVMAGTLGSLLRIALVSDGDPGPVRFLAVAIGLGLLANICAGIAFDPVTAGGADWTSMLFMASYAALGCGALHPSVGTITAPGQAPDDHLTRGRLVFLGLMLALAPLVGGGRAILGLPVDGVVIAISSAGLIPLVMIRIDRLADARRRAEQSLHRLAHFDALTGLPNRGACLARIADELATGPEGLTVLFGDLDGFKPVNDRLGHAAGDELLVEVAARLRGCVRGGDLVSRFGGDEFVIVCRGADAVEVIGARIRAMAARPLSIAGERVLVGVSMGAATARAGDTTDGLLGRADLAMYEAKRSKTVGELRLVEA